MSAATANTVPISWWKEPTKNQIPTDRAFSSGLRPPSVFLALLPIRVFPALGPAMEPSTGRVATARSLGRSVARRWRLSPARHQGKVVHESDRCDAARTKAALCA
jgi:hypothetical protein